MDADARAARVGGLDGEGGAERAPLRATDPVSAVSPKMARSGENGQLDRASSTIANVRLRLDVLTSKNRALNVSLRIWPRCARKPPPSATRCAPLREAETERDAVSRRAMRWRLATPAGKRSDARSRRRFRGANRRRARLRGCVAVAGAVAVAAEADARANLAEAEVETLKAKLALADAERAERRRRAGAKPSGREEEEEEEEEEADEDEDEDVRFGQAHDFVRYSSRGSRISTSRRSAWASSRASSSAPKPPPPFSRRGRAAPNAKRRAPTRNRGGVRGGGAAEARNDALRVAGAAMTGGNVGDNIGDDSDVAKRKRSPPSWALRAAAPVWRGTSAAAEFGLAASAVDVPRGPPGAPDGEGAPATGEATFWYDAARNEIRLLL